VVATVGSKALSRASGDAVAAASLSTFRKKTVANKPSAYSRPAKTCPTRKVKQASSDGEEDRVTESYPDWASERLAAFSAFELQVALKKSCAAMKREKPPVGFGRSKPWRQPGGLPNDCASSILDDLALALLPLFQKFPLWAAEWEWSSRFDDRFRQIPIKIALEALQPSESSMAENEPLLIFVRSSWSTQACVVMRCLNAEPNPNAWIYYACIVCEGTQSYIHEAPRPCWPLNHRWLDNYGRTSLHLAVNLARIAPQVVSQLIEWGADVNAQDVEWRRTPLGEIRSIGSRVDDSVRVIRCLAAAGADLNARFKSNVTALHLAATLAGSGQVMLVLVELGAKLNVRNDLGQEPLDLLLPLRGREDLPHRLRALECARALGGDLPPVEIEARKVRL
jgi:hypothetical protein